MTAQERPRRLIGGTGPRVNGAALTLIGATIAWLTLWCGWPIGGAIVFLAAALLAWEMLATVVNTAWANRAWVMYRLTRPATAPAPAPAPAADLGREIDAAGVDVWLAGTLTRVVDHRPDPGSPGTEAVLHEVTAGPYTGARVLVVTDATARGGVRERVGRVVPRTCTVASPAVLFGVDPCDYQPVNAT